MHLILTGGGTGGHIYPALAIAQACRSHIAPPPVVSYIGTRGRLEERIVPPAGIPLYYVDAAPLVRRASLRSLVATAADNASGFMQAIGLLQRLRPDVLVATGGYVTFPVVAALRVLRAFGLHRARVALLEPNAAPGLTNRLLAPLVDEIWYAFGRPSRRCRNAAVTGMPVRETLRRRRDARTARTALGLDPDGTTIVVMGGSQGAHSLNEGVAALIETGLPPWWQVVLVAGPRDYDELVRRLAGAARVRVIAYADDPGDVYAAATIVVARSGASTLGELAAIGIPALLVPYPHATADHQMRNARAYAAGGAAVVLPDAAVSGERLRAELTAALATARLAELQAAALAGARNDAAAVIASRVAALAAQKR